jgi:hypothetical protein
MVVGTKEGFSRKTVRFNGELLVQGPKLAEIAAVVVTKSGFAASVPGNEPAAAFKAALNVNVSDAPRFSFIEDGDTVTPEGSPVTVMAAPSPISMGEDTWTVMVCEDPGVSVSELLEDVRVT